jgi:hypothetical protein
MTDEKQRPLRTQLNEKLAALAQLQALAGLNAHASASSPGAMFGADYKTVLAQLELEAMQALADAAAELRKPTVSDLVDRLWASGPLSFTQIQATVAEANLPAGELETLLNRLRHARLLVTTAAPTSQDLHSRALQSADTLPPGSALDIEAALAGVLPAPLQGADLGNVDATTADVTATYSKLQTDQGRPWFNDRAREAGIDLNERLHSRF